jgi:lipopolysaccharide biosynthesis regulator YciM
LQEAIAMAPALARPLIDLAKLQSQLGRHQEALQTLLKLEKTAPQGLPLAAGLLANIAQASGQEATALELLKASYANIPSIDVIEAIVKLEKDPASARQWYVKHLERQASLVAAGKWIAGEKLQDEQHHALVQRALDQATKPLMRYRCAACGFEASSTSGNAPAARAGTVTQHAVLKSCMNTPWRPAPPPPCRGRHLRPGKAGSAVSAGKEIRALSAEPL